MRTVNLAPGMGGWLEEIWRWLLGPALHKVYRKTARLGEHLVFRFGPLDRGDCYNIVIFAQGKGLLGNARTKAAPINGMEQVASHLPLGLNDSERLAADIAGGGNQDLRRRK